MAAGTATNNLKHIDGSGGASPVFDAFEGDDVSGGSLDSDIFWGRAREEQALDYNIQRWSLDSRASAKAAPIPVTDLQQVTEEMLSKKRLSWRGCTDDSGVKKNKGRIAKVIPAYRVAFGSQSSRPFRVLSNVKIAVPNYRDNKETADEVDIPEDGARYFQGTEELLNFAMRPSSLPEEVEERNDHNREDLRKNHEASVVHPSSLYYPSAETPKIRGLSFNNNGRLSVKSGATQTPKMSMNSTRNSLEQRIQDYEGHVISDSNLLRRSTMKSSVNPEHSFSDTSLPEDGNTGHEGVTKFPPRLKAFKFPQETFGLKISEDGGVARDDVTIGKLTKKLQETGAQLQVPLPSGATLTVPLPVAKVFDHGLPDLSATGQNIISTEEMIQQRLDKERLAQRNEAENMVNEATLNALQERPSLVLKQKKYADLLMSRPMHELKDVGEVQGMKFATAQLDGSLLNHLPHYRKLDLAEFAQTEQANGPAETYEQLSRAVRQAALPAVPVVPNDAKTHDTPGNAHECMRQYLKDHKMDSSAQQLAQEWWLHHHERCNAGTEHDMKPFQATTQYLSLAENQAVLLKEFKAAKAAEKKKAKDVSRYQMDLRFMIINLKQLAAKNAKLQEALLQASKVSPEDHEEVQQERQHIEERFRGARQLNRNLHRQLKNQRINAEKLEAKLDDAGQLAVKMLPTRKQQPNDSSFPEYQGVHPLAFMTRKKPAQLARPNGMSIQQKTQAHSRSITDMAMSPFKHVVVTTGADGHWKVWNVKAMGKVAMKGSGHNGSIARCEYHPGGAFFATGGMDPLVNFWNSDDGSLKLQLKHSTGVTSLSFHSSGDFLLSGCNDGSVSLWDTNSNRCRSHLCRWNKIKNIHEGSIADCQILSYSNNAMTSSEDGQVILWDLRTESSQLFLKQNNPIKNAKVSTNGVIMGTTTKYGSELKLWDLRKLDGTTPLSVANYAPQLICDFNFDSSCHMVAFALNNGQVNFWDVKSGTSTVYPAHTPSAVKVTWDIWGEYMISGDEEGNGFLWS